MPFRRHPHPPRSGCAGRPKARPRARWTRKKGKWKEKKIWPSAEAAERFIRAHPGICAGYAAYVCPHCGGMHIGRKE